MAEVDRPVAVVGHSLGALTAPLVAEWLGADHLVFLAGIIPEPGRSLQDLAEVDVDRDLPLGPDEVVTDELGRFRITDSGARRALYHGCDSADRPHRGAARSRGVVTGARERCSGERLLGNSQLADEERQDLGLVPPRGVAGGGTVVAGPHLRA